MTVISFGLRVSPGLRHGSQLEVWGAANFVTICPLASKPMIGLSGLVDVMLVSVMGGQVSVHELVSSSTRGGTGFCILLLV